MSPLRTVYHTSPLARGVLVGGQVGVTLIVAVGVGVSLVIDVEERVVVEV